MPPKLTEDQKEHIKSPEDRDINKKVLKFNVDYLQLKRVMDGGNATKKDVGLRANKLKEHLAEIDRSVVEMKENDRREREAGELRHKNFLAEIANTKRKLGATTIRARNFDEYHLALADIDAMHQKSKETLRSALSNEPEITSYQAKIKKMEVQLAKIVITNEIDLTEKEKAKIRGQVSHKEWVEMSEPAWQQYQDRFDKFLLDRGLPQLEVDYGRLERSREMDRRREAFFAEQISSQSSEIEVAGSVEVDNGVKRGGDDAIEWEAYNRTDFYDDN